MTIEEKAKLYDEAFLRAKDCQYDGLALSQSVKDVIEYIFPELNESEDERMRKGLIAFLEDIWHFGKNANFDKWDKSDCSDWIAWLEKKREKKPEWSEDDENEFNHILNILNSVAEEQETKGYDNLIGTVDWLKSLKDKIQSKQSNKDNGKFECPNVKINDAIEVSSRMKYIADDLKPIAEFILDYADWDLDKDEWNQPTLTVPVFRVLDALIHRGKPYRSC